ncbi:RNA 2',3'-cyclic phosphodiesterase [Shewanella sp. AS1]|uniref:RNA 2',3'-cyclic phosphodiesterase n=1 Tax=Shewanella sp. AS1 TaxID=2907626 RepID=UPI001F3835CC|nr:RNA 2',3'-cyclic phosphodiesterase [Shewanella sp. AS1]MCE9677714.1 RNA 2',3'-cyclic phosphodiesterase [Shewanella sp. AS1]
MTKRLFLGFGTTTEQAQALLRLQHSCDCDGRAVPAANFHMTLKFLGQLTLEQEMGLIRGIDQLSQQQKLTRFQLALTQLDLWPKPRVLCLKGDTRRDASGKMDHQSPNDHALSSLYQACQTLCQQLDIAGDEHNFTPHITLFRKAKNYHKVKVSPLLLQPTALHLYQSISSETGVRYPILHSWPLTST